MAAASSSPVPTWLFNVTFRVYNNSTVENGLNELECVNISLPENETMTSEVHFFGSSLTVPTKRTFSGEINAEFFDRRWNSDMIQYIQLNGAGTTPFSTRKEFQFKIDKVIIDVCPMHAYEKNNDKVFKNIYKRYILYNPVITKFNYTEGLDASGEAALRYSITIHYDYWALDNNIHEEVIP